MSCLTLPAAKGRHCCTFPSALRIERAHMIYRLFHSTVQRTTGIVFRVLPVLACFLCVFVLLTLAFKACYDKYKLIDVYVVNINQFYMLPVLFHLSLTRSFVTLLLLLTPSPDSSKISKLYCGISSKIIGAILCMATNLCSRKEVSISTGLTDRNLARGVR